ncbi:hypothetical protein LIER_41778 [Lithospermum erythrorhizon]|uniref:Uncharacterized protein n=1 Tax=Lithospermum erythrorhizon TaxID=34254 RepID=A0AAV3RFZ7_LITER
MSLEDYYNKLTGSFEELVRLKPAHQCSCKHCTCDVVARYATDLDKERLHQFLVGIDDELYGVVRSNLLSRLPLPSLLSRPPLDEAYTVLSQDEDSKALARDKEISSPLLVHSFSVQVATTPLADLYLDRVQRAMRTYCRQRGHDTTTCFKIHGYSDWWEEQHKKSKSATRIVPVRANVVV